MGSICVQSVEMEDHYFIGFVILVVVFPHGTMYVVATGIRPFNCE